jgi:tRNA1Val (adenine37-N6)-methyltransferase
MGGTYTAPNVPGLQEALKRDDETLEPLLAAGGTILQKRHGYRFSLDAVVLADFVTRLQSKSKAHKEIRYLDLGTGCGIILILLAKWGKGLTGYGVEIQQPLTDMARRNLQLHSLQERFEILWLNLKDLPSHLPGASFDWITSNPPYRKVDSGRINPDPRKALARHELAASLEDLCRVMAHLLRDKGRAFVVYPASRFAGLVDRLRRVGLEPKTVRPVYPKPGEKACWVLVEAVRNGKEELSLERPLFVEEAQGGYTDEVQAMFRWEV